ncbi:hypothetical protein CSKR_101690 [Clonorchis sinensis]|uniref:Uncharacterized protein n=1 Tax=Clonorchis sinensis TaxID=79923 RepID=A0A419PHD0_CLOSI|nr:hypothetical protein CSKR_101690 [Clonorchis sinensis]
MTLHFVGQSTCQRSNFSQFIEKHLCLPFLFKDENDVVCIFQIDKVFFKSSLNTGIYKSFQRSSHYIVDHESSVKFSQNKSPHTFNLEDEETMFLRHLNINQPGMKDSGIETFSRAELKLASTLICISSRYSPEI